MRTILVVVLAVLIGLSVPAPLVFAYGGGGGGGGGAGAGAEDHEHASGGVSWAPNPNGEDVIGSSVWSGPHPEGPFQADKSIQDALEELAQGAGSIYSDDQVRENLEWAQRAGILRGVEIPPGLARFLTRGGSTSATSQSTGTASGTPQQTAPDKSAQRDAKVADYVSIGLDVYVWYKEQQAQGKNVTPEEMEGRIRAEVINYKVKNATPEDVNKAVQKIAKKVKKFLAFF